MPLFETEHSSDGVFFKNRSHAFNPVPPSIPYQLGDRQAAAAPCIGDTLWTSVHKDG